MKQFNIFFRAKIGITLLLLGLSPVELQKHALAQEPVSSGSSESGSANQIQGRLKSSLHSSAVSMSSYANRLLSEHIADGQSFVWIDIDWNEDAVRRAVGNLIDVENANGGGGSEGAGVALPYELRTTTWAFSRLDEVAKGNIQPYIRKLSVSLYLDSSLPEDVEVVARKILVHALPFLENRGDTIDVQKRNMGRVDLKQKIEDAQNQIRDLQKESQALQLSLNQEKSAKDSIASQIKTLEGTETTLRGQLESESRLRKEVETNLSGLQSELDEMKSVPEFLREMRKYVKGFEIPVAALLFVVILCLFLFFWLIVESLMKSRTMERLAGSIALIADSLKGGQKDGGGSDAEKKKEVVSTESKSAGEEKAAIRVAFPTLPPEQVDQLNRDAKAIVEKLVALRFPVLITMKSWITRGEESRVAKCLTLLSADEQTQYIKSFSADEADSIVNAFIESPLPGEAAALISQLYQEVRIYIDVRPDWVQRLGEPSFLKLGIESLAHVCQSQDANSLSFLLFLLPRRLAAQLLELLSSDLASAALRGLGAMDQISADDAGSRLEKINRAAAEQSAAERSAVAAQSIALYESAREEQRSAIMGGLEGNRNVLDYVLRSVVSMDKIFSLDNDALSEVLDPFGPRELATLLTGLNPDYVDKVRQFLSRTAFISLQSEMSRISEKPALLKKAAKTSLALQKELIRRVRSMVRDGDISFDESNTSSGGAQDNAQPLGQSA